MTDPQLIDTLLNASTGAKFRKADLHVHTPASSDMGPDWRSARPRDVVNFALAADLDIIAVTDHNTIDWCDPVREAASDTRLHVLPGAEISTRHGHLLAIFDEATDVADIRELLIRADFTRDRYGSLEAASSLGMDELAVRINEMGGIAVPAHVNGPKGLMTFPIADERRRVASSSAIRAFEITDPSRRLEYEEGKTAEMDRRITCIMGSDCRSPSSSTHELNAIGSRFTNLKMDEVSIYGIRQALIDPRMRVRLPQASESSPASTIDGILINGGFLHGQNLRFSNNLTCMIGDTGSGKSFVIELIRSALQQQASICKISSEVTSLLEACLNGINSISVVVTKNDTSYVIQQTLDNGVGDIPIVSRVTEDGLEDLDEPINVPDFFPIKAYSQSEILEFARQPAARLSLTDDLIDISVEESEINDTKTELRANAAGVLDSQRKLSEALERLDSLSTIQEQIQRTSDILDHPRVKAHTLWGAEQRMLKGLMDTMTAFQATAQQSFPIWPTGSVPTVPATTPNSDLLTAAAKVQDDVVQLISSTQSSFQQDVASQKQILACIHSTWSERFQIEQKEYEDLLKSIDTDGRGLAAISRRLKSLQDQEADLLGLEKEIQSELQPKIALLNEKRENLLNRLQELRSAITKKRRTKAAQLTRALTRRIVVDVNEAGHGEGFRRMLREIRVGSRVRDTDIETMSRDLHPVPFVKSILSEDFDELERVAGISAAVFRRLHDSIVERKLIPELYELQLVDVDDIIRIKFAVAEGEYRELERLAHGQKCTVILAVAMAEGDSPLIVDQPEDALHAPYIEDNIVTSLREHRGQRQYVFATRNANVLVSGDAEQVIVMDAESSSGRVKRTGSIDQFRTRDLILLHLEGGRTAFDRKRQKYAIDSS